MKRITIDLPEEDLTRLQVLAGEAGISPEELPATGVREWLSTPERDFQEAAAYVLRKNAELYRRQA